MEMTNQTLFNGGVVAGFCGDDPNIPRVFVTTPDSFVTGAVNPLEPVVRDSIKENENLRSILIQVSAGNCTYLSLLY